MKIYRDYLIKQTLFLLLLFLIIFAFVFIVGNMVKLSHLLMNGKISIIDLGKVFACFIPFVIGYTLPVAMICAVVFLFSKLSADNEINALRSTGVGLIEIVKPVLALSVVLSIATFVVNDKIEPEAHYRARKIIRQIGIKEPVAYIEPGTFIDIFPNYIIFVYRMEGKFLQDVRIYQLQGEKPPRIFIAKRGQVLVDKGARKIRFKLEDVISDEIDPMKPDKIYRFYSRQYFINFDLPEKAESKISRKIKEYPVKKLIAMARDYKSKGISPEPIWLEIHKRLSFALAPFVLTIFAIPLSIKTARSETSVGLVLVAVISLTYYLAMLASEAVVVKGWMSPEKALYLPDITFGVIGLFLFWRQR